MGGFADFWAQSDPIGRAVALLLLAMSVSAWALILWKAWLLRRAGRRVPSTTSAPPWVIWAVFAVVVGFGVLRNLPGFAWLSPA